MVQGVLGAQEGAGVGAAGLVGDDLVVFEAKDEDAKFNMELVKKKLEELKQQQQQQKQDNKDQNKEDEKKDEQQQEKQDQKDDQKKDEQQKKEEQKKDEEQQKSEEQKQQDQAKKDEQAKKEEESQKKPDQQQAQDQRGQEPDKSAQQPNYARVMQMTPQQAQQLLDALKSEERAMIFQPENLRTNRPRDRVFKDW